ncbi:MAG: V-type ATP synthase subunit I [Pirellulales bacterium]|nr:V-type ATP synthase subunit I [Pirellulales bacterium]
MSIVPLDKATICGPLAQRDAALDALQRFGRLHLINLNDATTPKRGDSLKSADARTALKHLQSCPLRRRAPQRCRNFDFRRVVAKALKNKRQHEALVDERDEVAKAIEIATPWGEFRQPKKGEFGSARLWFYVVPRRDADRVRQSAVPCQIVAVDPTALYCVVVAAEEPTPRPGERVELDRRPLSELAARREEIDDALEDLHWERVALTRWIPRLKRSLDAADDAAARAWAERLALSEPELFAIQAWVPQAARDELEEVTRGLGLALKLAPPDPADEPPTLLDNPDRVAGAEGAVTFYITPAYRAWDPTPVMFVSFSLFFGMILADAGYGLVLAAALGLFWRRLGATRKGAQFRTLLATIVGATIVFGSMTGSYFGLAPRPDSTLGRLRVLDFAARGQMMGLSILIGVGHLSLANLVTAWRARHSLRALGSIGWVLMMIGALMAAAELLATPWGATVAPWGKGLVVLGVAAVLLFSSDRPLKAARLRDWLGRVVDGVSALTGITKLFGDVLSYLRLFALGLASGQLAVTFNELASHMAEKRGLGLLLASVILIAGHGINLALGLMGGVVHGLRLNCIEFFNWSLTEEGRPFEPYQKKVRQ